MPSKHNVSQVAILEEKVSRAKSVAIVEYAGTTVSDQVELRRNLRRANSEFFVAKNTLINRVTGNKLKDSLEGMNAIVLSYDDEVAGLKELVTYHEKTDKLVVKGGIVNDSLLTEAEVKALSKLPGKQEMIAQLISRIQGPAYGLVNVLQAGVRNLTYAIKAIEKQKQEAGA